MPCFHPITAYQTIDGSVIFSEHKGDVVRTLQLPCGNCVGCRLERSRQWATRCVHEASLYSQNCFITLTYDEEHVPANGSLHYADFQKFMKRLRKYAPLGVRFYMCGEYGENFDRPHYHAIIFNYDFPDKTLWKKGQNNSSIYRSKILETLWPFGHSSTGAANFQSAAYVARYVMKKINGDLSSTHYGTKTPEFNRMSLKPGIGADWFTKYKKDVFPRSYVVINGKETKPPKYYDRLYSKINPEKFEEVQWAREQQMQALKSDFTPERLKVKETVTKSLLSQYKRSIK